MSKELQQQMINQSRQNAESAIMGVYNSGLPGLENIKWDSENYEAVFLVINNAFLADNNSNDAVSAIIYIGLYAPMIQVYQGKGLATQTWIGWGDDDFNVVGEVYSPEFLKQFEN